MFLQEVEMPAHDILIVAHGGPRLSLARLHEMNFACRLVNERQHHTEGDTMFGQDVGREGITMVDKVACKDGRKMNVATLGRRDLIDAAAHRACQPLNHGVGQSVGCFNEDRNFAEVNLLAL